MVESVPRHCTTSKNMFIKICGITNLEDAQNAIAFGAGAIGLVFAESPRKVTPGKAKEIIKHLKGGILKVGVFVNEPADKVEETARFCGLDAVQLHGDEGPDYCSKFQPKADPPSAEKIIKVIKAFRVKDETSLLSLKGYTGVFAYLLDSFSKDRYGGTGKVFDWTLALKAKAMGKPVILSGGIGLDNIRNAIKAVRPYGIDISSSIEKEPGKKETLLMKRLIDAIKALD